MWGVAVGNKGNESLAPVMDTYRHPTQEQGQLRLSKEWMVLYSWCGNSLRIRLIVTVQKSFLNRLWFCRKEGGGLWRDEQDPERQVKGRFKEQELDHPGLGGCQVDELERVVLISCPSHLALFGLV